MNVVAEYGFNADESKIISPSQARANRNIESLPRFAVSLQIAPEQNRSPASASSAMCGLSAKRILGRLPFTVFTFEQKPQRGKTAHLTRADLIVNQNEQV